MLIISSCSKTEIQDSKQPEQTIEKPIQSFSGVSVVDDRLVFESQSSFEDVLNYLYLNQDDEFALDKAFQNFTSYLKALENLEKSGFKDYEQYPNLVHLVDGYDIDPSVEPVVEFELLKSLLNADGIVQIGDKIHKYTDKNVLITKNVNAIPYLIDGRYDDIGDLEKIPILRTVQEISDREAMFGYCTREFSYGGGRKLIGKAVSIYVQGGISEIYLKTEIRRRTWWGAWVLAKFPEIVLRGSGTFHLFGYPLGYGDINYSYNITKFNASKIKQTILWNWNYPTPYIFNNNNTFHDARWWVGCRVII